MSAVGDAVEDPIEQQSLDMVAATLAAATVGAVGRSMSSEYAVEKFFEIRRLLTEGAPKKPGVIPLRIPSRER
jgi:hypothetical protein